MNTRLLCPTCKRYTQIDGRGFFMYHARERRPGEVGYPSPTFCEGSGKKAVAGIFTPPPDPDDGPASIGGATFFGVRLPADIPFYDGRWPDGAAFPRASWGEVLIGSDVIAAHLGLLTGREVATHNQGIGFVFRAQQFRREMS